MTTSKITPLLGSLLMLVLLGGCKIINEGSEAARFDSAKSLDPGGRPMDVEILDLDGDSDLDILVANQTSNTLSIHLGNGEGDFESPTFVSLAGSPSALASIDANEDGAPDYLVALEDQDAVVHYRNQGDGTFSAVSTTSVGAEPFSVTVGDFNGDGLDDFATADYGADQVSVALAVSDTDFATPTVLAALNTPITVRAADLNGDAKDDLLLLHYTTTGVLSSFMGVGDGTFGPRNDFATDGVAPRGIIVFDFNGDSVLDALVANEGAFENGSIRLLFGAGDTTFGAATSLDNVSGLEPRAIALGDFDGDDDQDIVISDSSTINTALSDTAVSFHFRNADGTYGVADEVVTTASTPVDIAVGDLNQDGIDDLATSDQTAETVSVILSRN